METSFNNLLQFLQPIGQPSSRTFSGWLATVTGNLLVDLFWFGGIAGLIAILYGGFVYITSAGDADKAAKGGRSLVNGLIGMVLAALALVIIGVAQRLLNSL